MIAAVIAAIIGGCGSSGSSGTAAGGGYRSPLETPLTTASFSKAQYIVKANAVCKEDWAEILENFASYQDERGPSVGDRKLFAGASHRFVLPSIQIEFDHLHYLGAPAGEQPQVEDMLAAMQSDIYDGQDQRIFSPGQLEAIFRNFNRLARQYGINECPVVKGLF